MLRMLKRWGGIGIRRWALVPTRVGRHRKWSYIPKNHAFVVHYLFKMLRYRGKNIGIHEIETVIQSILPGSQLIGDKYPDYIFELDSLAREDGLSILVIYRDCRDVTGSVLRRVHREWRNMRFFIKKLDSAEKVAKRWVRAIESMERNKDIVHIIRYEDLAREKKQTLKALGQWLGVDSTGFPANIIKNTRIGTFKSALSDEDLEKVMDVAGPTMTRLGYL